jgi:preprotein translocase subunit SecB
MTDTGAGAENDAQAGAGGAPLVIQGQYLKDLSFESPRTPNSLTLKQAPAIEVNVNASARKLAERTYEVSLEIRTDARHEEDPVFLVELAYAAVVSVGENVAEDSVKPMLLIEVPRLLFPFARAILSNMTREGGFPPLQLQPVDFTRLYAQQQQQGGGGNGSGNGGDGSASPATIQD